ncbi:MAG: hypothetical protein J5844_04680 [Clostridia bacterium]|nr:hypothetical protein [Clostridia bacterium]
MKKLLFTLALSFLLSVSVFAIDASEHTVKVSHEKELVKVEVSVSKGNAIVGHFGIKFNPEKLELVKSDGSTLPDVIPEKNEDGKSYIQSVVKTSSKDIVITTEANKSSDFISTSNGYVLFGWYATMNIDSVNPDLNGGKIAEIYFKLKGGSFGGLTDADIAPITAKECAHLSDWSKGIIVINSDNNVYSSISDDEKTVLKTSVVFSPDSSGESGESGGETPGKDEKDEKDEDNKDEKDEKDENSDGKEGGNGGLIDSNASETKMGLELRVYSGKIRVLWNNKAETGVKKYFLQFKEINGNVFHTVDGIAEITRSVTVSDIKISDIASVELASVYEDGKIKYETVNIKK